MNFILRRIAHSCLHSGTASSREHAVRLLGRSRSPQDIQALIEIIKQHPHADTRAQAITALLPLSTDIVIETFESALAEDPSEGVRLAAFDALASLNQSIPLAALVDALQHKNVGIRVAGVRMLRRAATPPALEHLLNALGDSHAEVRAAVNDALAEMNDPCTVPRLVALLLAKKGHDVGDLLLTLIRRNPASLALVTDAQVSKLALLKDRDDRKPIYAANETCNAFRHMAPARVIVGQRGNYYDRALLRQYAQQERLRRQACSLESESEEHA